MPYPASKTLDEFDRTHLITLSTGQATALTMSYKDVSLARRKRFAFYRAWRHLDCPKILRIRLEGVTLTLSTLEPFQ